MGVIVAATEKLNFLYHSYGGAFDATGSQVPGTSGTANRLGISFTGSVCNTRPLAQLTPVTFGVESNPGRYYRWYSIEAVGNFTRAGSKACFSVVQIGSFADGIMSSRPLVQLHF